MYVVLQSCRRNLNTVGKPDIIPGLPELAGLVKQMAAQWETRMQQQEAAQMDTDSTAVEETAAADDDTSAAMPSSEGREPSNAVLVMHEAGVQPVAQTSDPETVPASISGPDEADTGGAVDVNADPTLSDVVSDLVASTTAAGAASARDSTGTADAAESRRQKKQKASTKL